MMRIGLVEFINAYPFHFALEDENLTLAPPATINHLFQQKQLDACIGSSINALESAYLPDLCIAAKGAIKSVFLHTKVPPAQIKTLKLDPQSGTSNALAQILLQDHFKCTFSLTKSCADAFVSIGDKALLHPTYPGYQTIDLATAWYEMTKLPFVFALFFHQPGLDLMQISRKIQKKLDWIQEHFETFTQQAANDFSLPPHFLADYFRLCRYHLESDEKKGLELFVHTIRTRHHSLLLC